MTILKEMLLWKKRRKLVKATKNSILENEVMIGFYKSFKHNDKKLDADREIKIDNLKNTNDFNQKFVDYVCGL